jgi:type IV pilus assembly protein PilC
MSFIILPGQLAQLAELYHQLGTMTSSGIGIIQAIDMLRRSSNSRAYAKPLGHIVEALRKGATLTEAIAMTPKWLPAFDLSLIEAGEKSGRLDACFKLLANYYADRATLMRNVISDMMYPLFIVHFAIMLGPLPQMIVGNASVASYIYQVGRILFPAYAIVIAVIFACQGRHGETVRSIVENVVHLIPFLGAGRRQLAYARLCSALEALVSAGVPIIDSWYMAADACGSPAVRRVIYSWREGLNRGETPADMLRSNNFFPELFVSLYSTGEISGKIDESLKRMYSIFQESSTRLIRGFAQWLPKLIFIGIALFIGYQIVSFYSHYYGDMFKELNK